MTSRDAEVVEVVDQLADDLEPSLGERGCDAGRRRARRLLAVVAVALLQRAEHALDALQALAQLALGLADLVAAGSGLGEHGATLRARRS